MAPILVFLGGMLLVVLFCWIAIKRRAQYHPALDDLVEAHDLEFTKPIPQPIVEGTYRGLPVRISIRIENRSTRDPNVQHTTYSTELPDDVVPLEEHDGLAPTSGGSENAEVRYEVGDGRVELVRRGDVEDRAEHERMLDWLADFDRNLRRRIENDGVDETDDLFGPEADVKW